MEIDEYEHGVPSWVDLGTSDTQKAAEFYGALFGWDVQEGPPETGGYSIAHLREKAVAGLGPQQNPGPPYWTTYVNVDDADAVAKLVDENGGTTYMAPMDVMEVGRMAIFADPQGAAFGVWQAGTHKGAGIVNEPGTFSWAELVTTDVDAAKAFYGAVFGWGADTHGEGVGAYTEWKVGDRAVGGCMEKPPGMPAEIPPYWGVYFNVADIAASVKEVEALGGSVMMPPQKIEPGTFAVVNDPQGAMFQLIELSEVPS